MQFFELAGDALDCCSQADDCFAGFVGAAGEARYGHPGNANRGAQDRCVDFNHRCLWCLLVQFSPKQRWRLPPPLGLRQSGHHRALAYDGDRTAR